MASVKERARWARAFDAVSERMNRQKKSIERLVLINTECVAALAEIAGTNCDGSSCVERAQQALDRSRELADATKQFIEDTDRETPIPDDPRSTR